MRLGLVSQGPGRTGPIAAKRQSAPSRANWTGQNKTSTMFAVLPVPRANAVAPRRAEGHSITQVLHPRHGFKCTIMYCRPRPHEGCTSNDVYVKEKKSLYQKFSKNRSISAAKETAAETCRYKGRHVDMEAANVYVCLATGSLRR
jgi:hypothetical protein